MSETAVSDIVQQLQTAEPNQHIDLLQDYLRHTLASVLSIDPTLIDPYKPFGMMGLDSLMGVEFRNRLETGLTLVLSATLVWNYPTVNDLTNYLTNRLELNPEERSEQETTVAEPLPATDTQLEEITLNISELSEDEALQALLGGS